MISVNVYRNPLQPEKREQTHGHACDTLRDLTRRLNGGSGEWPFPTIAVVDGQAWMRGRWNEPLSDGMVIEFRSSLKGGGAGRTGVAGGIAAGFTTGLSTGLVPIGMGLQSLGAISGVDALGGIGGRLVDFGGAGRLTPGLPENPSLPSALQSESGSPNYSINARGNRKRLGEPVPIVYGTMRVFPDLAAESYVENVTQDLSSGVKATGVINFNIESVDGIYNLTTVSDGTTFTISDGSTTVTFEFDNNSSVGGGNTSVTLVADDPTASITNFRDAINASALGITCSISTVFNVIYASLLNDSYGSTGNVPITSANFSGVKSGMSGGESAPQSSEQYLNLPLCIGYGEFDIDQDTIRLGDSVESFFRTVQICPPGTTMDILYPHVVNHTDLTGKKLSTSEEYFSYGNKCQETVLGITADFVFPSGLWSTSGTTFTNNTIDVTLYARYGNSGESFAIGDSGTVSTTMNNRDNAKFSIKYMFASPVTHTDSYQIMVKAKRGAAESTTSDKADACQMVGCRRIISTSYAFAGVTSMAVKIKASDTINGDIADKLSVIVSRKIPIWNGTSWSANTATRSIAWALADILRNSDYGMGLDDSLIDLDALLALDTIWDGRGDYFDGVFDQTVTAWEALQKVARCGRAVPVLVSGKVTFVRDGAKSVRSAIFNPSNIAPGSLSIKYSFRQESEPDGINLTYIDPSTWQTERVIVAMPGVTGDPSMPQEVNLFGCTNTAQATREATYMARRFAYLHKVMSWQTELDGRLLMLGDMVALAHDVPAWSNSAETLSHVFASGTTTIGISEPVTWGAGTYYALFKKQDGTVSGPHTIATHPTSTSFTITGALGFTPSTTLENGDRTTAVMYTGTVQDVVITDISPSGETSVTITAVPYDARIHAAGA